MTEEAKPPRGRELPLESFAGAALVLVGVLFLLQNYGVLDLDVGVRNWWAFFILIPAAGSFIRAWRSWGSPAAIPPLVGGAILVAVTLIFMLELPWGRVWPVLLIIAGLGGLAGAWTRR